MSSMGGMTQQGTQGTFNQPGMQGGMQSGTGASDPTYDLISVLYHCLDGAASGQKYIQDAQGDQELAQFFQQVVQEHRQLAEKGKQLLARRLSGTSTRGQ